VTSPHSADEYREQLKKLQPQGLAFPTDDESNWAKLLDAFAQTLARIDNAAIRLLNEAFPDTTSELLPDWERVAGLPDECAEVNDTFAIRRANLLTKLALIGGQTPQYFIDLAAIYGFEITITELHPFLIGESGMGDPLGGDEWHYVWQVNGPLNTVTKFKAGRGRAGEPLAVWSVTRLGCFINKYKPAHTVVIYE
jgi:uncharacterized protein YmfQ (DUF2313 family)